MIVALLLCLFGDEPDFKNLKVLPPDISKDELMSVMSSWSTGLGVNCKHCHWGPTELFDDLVYER